MEKYSSQDTVAQDTVIQNTVTKSNQVQINQANDLSSQDIAAINQPKPANYNSNIVKFKQKAIDQGRFLKRWAQEPLITGAVAPSSKLLANALAQAIVINENDARPIVELGPGTGVVTKAIRERFPNQRFIAIEYSEDFAKDLQAKFTDVEILRGDAYNMKSILADNGVTEVSQVVSCLPLFTKPPELRSNLLQQAFDLMNGDGAFVQFSYALVPAFDTQLIAHKAKASPWIFRNVPPARVWTYKPA